MAAEPGIGSKLLNARLKPNIHAINLTVSFMLCVALAMVVGWLVLSINKIDTLENSLERMRFEIQALRQLETNRILEVEKSFDGLRTSISGVENRTETIEKRLNIGVGDIGVGSATAGAPNENPPPTRRIILDDGSLVIKTPLVE